METKNEHSRMKRGRTVFDDQGDSIPEKRSHTDSNADDAISEHPPDSFASLTLLPEVTRQALSEGEFSVMTRVQQLAIPPALRGKDLLVQSKTGSGKTLAFLLPTVGLLSSAKFSPRNGTGALFLSPTRELALQLFQTSKTIMKYNTQTIALLMGGANRNDEVIRLRKGATIVVGTPGRVLDHLMNTDCWKLKHLKMLVIDEADRMLDIGFEEEMREILKRLPKERQTMLFSATQTTKVEDLAYVSFRDRPLFIDVKEDDNWNGVDSEKDSTGNVSTVAGLQQGYVVCPASNRFLLLFTFLKRNKGKKVMVFFSSCNSVKYHAELLNYVDVPVVDLHGKQKQSKRTKTFLSFCDQSSGILLSTDVAARGLDIPDVDWIVQYDPPDEPKEYIHRVGRTARAGRHGKALLFLLPEELGFLGYLKKAKVPLNEYDFPENKVLNVQSSLEALVAQNYYLNQSAREGLRAYLLAYASHAMKNVFNIHKLNIDGISKSFGFTEYPRCVDLSSKWNNNIITISFRYDELNYRAN